MLNKVFSIVTFSFIATTFLSFSDIQTPSNSQDITSINTLKEDNITTKVKWYTWEEAVKAAKTEKRKIFVDVYTDWCGWCKRMDKNTFQHSSVAKYLNEEFYAVKLNAEQKGDILFKGHTFKYVKQGRRGYHQLAYELLNGRMSYPTVVILNEEYERILIAPGYQEAKDFKNILKYAADEAYKNKTWQQFSAETKKEEEAQAAAKKELESKKKAEPKKKENGKADDKKEVSARDAGK